MKEIIFSLALMLSTATVDTPRNEMNAAQRETTANDQIARQEKIKDSLKVHIKVSDDILERRGFDTHK